MPKWLLIAIMMIALVTGCQQVAVTAPPEPVSSVAVPTPPSELVPPRVILKPKFTLGPDEQKQTYERVIARGKPSHGEPVIIQITEKEFFKLQGLTASIHDIDGQPYEVLFKGDEVVDLTSLGANGSLPILSPDHRSISLTRSGHKLFQIYDIATGEMTTVPVFESFYPLKAYDYWGVTPLWTHDSNHLYFSGASSGKSRLFRVDRDGRNLIQCFPNMMVYKLWGLTKRGDLVATAGEPGKVALLREDSASVTTIGEITAQVGATSPSGNLVIAAPRENAFIDVLDIPQGATARVQLGTHKYGSSPVGWSPSEERLATIINPAIEGEPAVVVVDWRQRSVIRVPISKDYYQSWQPVTWLDEEMFVIWLKEANASSVLGPNTLPFLVRLPQSDIRLLGGSNSPTAAIDPTNPEQVALEFANAVVTGDAERARRIAIDAFDAKNTVMSGRLIMIPPYVHLGSLRTVSEGVRLDVLVKFEFSNGPSWSNLQIDLVRSDAKGWLVSDMMVTFLGDDDPTDPGYVPRWKGKFSRAAEFREQLSPNRWLTVDAESGAVNVVVLAYEDAPIEAPWYGTSLKGKFITVWGEDSGRDGEGRQVITVRSFKHGMRPPKSPV